MGMQIHFHVADIPDHYKVHKHSDAIDDSDIGGNTYYDYYVVINENSYTFDTDENHTSAWFDIGQLGENAVAKLHWLIENRICFNAS